MGIIQNWNDCYTFCNHLHWSNSEPKRPPLSPFLLFVSGDWKVASCNKSSWSVQSWGTQRKRPVSNVPPTHRGAHTMNLAPLIWMSVRFVPLFPLAKKKKKKKDSTLALCFHFYTWRRKTAAIFVKRRRIGCEISHAVCTNTSFNIRRAFLLLSSSVHEILSIPPTAMHHGPANHSQ